MSRFTKAERKKAKLRLAITGVSGSGKTYSALRIAKGMGGRVAVIDSENDSSSLYANEFDFDSISLNDHSPESYIKAVNDATKEGYEIVIIDSLTHVWNWCKAEIDRLGDSVFKGNTWAAWSKVTPRYDALFQCIVQSKVHIIGTIRSKTETAQEVGANGKKRVVKLGMKTELRDGSEFEFTTVIDLVHENKGASVSKDRTHVFMGMNDIPLDEEIGRTLMNWLEQGVDPYVNDKQLNALLSNLNQVTHQQALAKINSQHPDFSTINASDYELMMGKIDIVIKWQATQPAEQSEQSEQSTNQQQIH
jgi:hypothetical protein